MLTIPAAVCIAGAGTKRRLSFASIRIARGCPGPLQGDGEEGTGIARCCGTQAAGGGGGRPGTSAEGCSPLPQRHEPLPGSHSNPNHVSGRFLILHGSPRGGAALSCRPSPPLGTHFRRCLSPETHRCPDGSVPAWAPCRDTLH